MISAFFVVKFLSARVSDAQMANSEQGAVRLVLVAFDFPTVGEHDLLDHGKSQTSSMRVCGKVWFENFAAV